MRRQCGAGIELSWEGYLRVPKPSLEHVDHLKVSRAVHKVPLEYKLCEIIKQLGLEAARTAARERTLSIVAQYVRRGHYNSYRPYGVEFGGATRVTISPCRFLPDPHGILIAPPQFTGYLIGLPGARFSCTLAEDSTLLRYMLAKIETLEAARYLMTRKVFWTPTSAGIETEG